MAKRYRLTNNSDETEISALISGDTVFAIPYFQRAYKWKPPRLRQLEKDILQVVDKDDCHFFGAIIVHGRRSNPSDPDVFDVIDGQQRLTTLIVYLCAIVKILCLHRQHAEAAGLFLKYLVVGRDTKLASNLKLHPCKEDRAQLNAVYRELLADPAFTAELAVSDQNSCRRTSGTQVDCVATTRSPSDFSGSKCGTKGSSVSRPSAARSLNA